jgi:hypothetical protein
VTEPAVKAVAGFVALTAGVVALIAVAEGGASTVTAVRVAVPAQARSLYVYQGSAPEDASGWQQCFAVNGAVEVTTPSVLASPGEREWNFFAYAEPGCPVSGGEPLAAARNVTAPEDLTAWSVILR